MDQGLQGEVGLMFLEDDSPVASGWCGNFLIDGQKSEQTRGIQMWTWTATATGYFEFLSSVLMP